MKKNDEKKVFYIKLGHEGRYAQECIDKDQIWLDYRSLEHETALEGDAEKIIEAFMKQGSKQSAASNHARQVLLFYTEPRDTMWVTFHNDRLHWCFTEEEIIHDAETNTKTRKVIGKWSSKDRAEENDLVYDKLSGIIMKTRGYRGTICEIKGKAKDYLFKKLDGKKLDDVYNAEKARDSLKKSVVYLIKLLTWSDFEILIDLIFSRAGWQRISAVGKTQALLDLDLIEPITGQRIMVQIKSKSNLPEYKKYSEDFGKKTIYSDFYYFVHSPDKNLLKYYKENKENVKLYDADRIADLCVKFGLVDWLLDKMS